MKVAFIRDVLKESKQSKSHMEHGRMCQNMLIGKHSTINYFGIGSFISFFIILYTVFFVYIHVFKHIYEPNLHHLQQIQLKQFVLQIEMIFFVI